MFQDRLQKLREERGYSVKEVAAALNLPYTTYNNYEKNTREPNGEILCRIAAFFSVSLDYLLGMTNAAQNHTQSPEMQAVCTKLKELDAHGKRLVSLVLEEEYIRCRALQQEQRKPMRIIRSSLYRVSAGTGIFLDDDTAWEEIQVPDTPEARKADFALRISGDSMEPIYHDGDIVLVEQTEVLHVGEIGIFFVNGNGYIKKFGGDRLISLNDAYEDIYLTEQARCFGRVLGRA
ncbi:MAG: S24 family peptidase [Ruminococcus callidus]|nr:S24 family peptidase [Ruminococcus callidus]